MYNYITLEVFIELKKKRTIITIVSFIVHPNGRPFVAHNERLVVIMSVYVYVL